MIHFDTNVLIALPLLARGRHPLVQRLARGEAAATSALAWFEYMCGPVDEAEEHMTHAAIGGRIIALDETAAARAAVLFNAVGRKRQLRTDSLIAATAILADAPLATFNAEDFEPFVQYGLKLLALSPG